MCLDTDVFIGLLKGDSKAIALINKLQSTGNSLKTTIITAYELLKGAAISSKPQENLKIVRDLLSNINILPLNYGSCEEAAEIYSSLKSKGQTIGEFDILIAAIVKYNNEYLISRDKHFKLIENLNIQTW
ncbi:MAG: type II toxin-antitoxin system VapC family toxin [Nitrososphaerota archaeon]